MLYRVNVGLKTFCLSGYTIGFRPFTQTLNFAQKVLRLCKWLIEITDFPLFLASIILRMLNLNGPLQLGGTSNKQLRYPELTTTSYKGCIRNVISQGKYYDLKNPSLKNGTKEMCPMMDQHCQQHQCHRRATCVPSWTGYTCSCPFGRAGRTCGQSKIDNYIL